MHALGYVSLIFFELFVVLLYLFSEQEWNPSSQMFLTVPRATAIKKLAEAAKVPKETAKTACPVNLQAKPFGVASAAAG